jgi:hypothetical protein
MLSMPHIFWSMALRVCIDFTDGTSSTSFTFRSHKEDQAVAEKTLFVGGA